jgi:copper(I)-binding protein
MLVRNLGFRDDALLGASSPIADRVELHHSPLVAGVRTMEPFNDEVTLPAGSVTIFEPESVHLMLIDTRESLVQGDSFPIVLRFQRAREVSVTGRVRRKVDAAGVTPIPPVMAGDIEISLVSAPPAPAAQRS